MARTRLNRLSLFLLVAAIGQGAVSPVHAGGSFSLNLSPRNAEEAGLLSTGIRAYSLYRGLKSGEIRQLGRGNAAGLSQAGRGNFGYIRQRGDSHSATLQQTGDDNAYAIFQNGRNTRTDVVQDENNGSGATFSYGW